MGNIARARAATSKPIGGTLKVWLNTDVSKERSDVFRELQAEEAKLEGRPALPKSATTKVTKLRERLHEIEERESEHAHLLYFEKLPGLDFANLGDEFPPRAGNPTDMELGFNTRSTTLAAARRNGCELIEDPDGDFRTPTQPDKVFRKVPLDDDDWSAILEIGSAYDVNGLEGLILNLNVYYSSQMVARWKKG